MSKVENTVPPRQALMTMLHGIPVTHAIATAAELGIFACLKDGPVDVSDVAKAVNTLDAPTYRLMRALSSLGVLDEHAGRKFSLTPMGECLLPGVPGSLDALARMHGASWGSAAFAEFAHSLRTGESGFRKYHGKGLFEWLSLHPEEEALFGNAMSTLSGFEAQLVVSSYDFSSVSRIVDVGGGHGVLLSRILESAPAAHGVLFDSAHVVERTKQAWQGSALATRCEIVAGDFFERVPSGGDLYVLKHILHDWDDARAEKILRNVSAAMKPGARLLVAEQGLAPPGVPSPGKLMDIVMLALTDGGRERSAEDHGRLFERTGLHFEREIATPGPITLFVGRR